MRYRSKLYRIVFARPIFRRLNSRLLYLALHGLGVLNYESDEISGERFLIHKWLPGKMSNSKMVFLDVGANVGHYSAMLLEKFPTAFVHAFEPHPKTFATLVGNGFAAHRAKCHNFALGEFPDSLILYDRADQDGSQHASLHQASITEFHEQTAVATKVAVQTLDDVAAREGITYIDFLKIDTEGHELAVLRGASRLLRERKIGIIQFEFNALNVYSRVFFRDFRSILHNFELFRLLPNGLLVLDASVTTTEIFGYQNILAVPHSAQ